MLLTDAIKLIDNTYIRNDGAGKWADLGCGSGLFTKALASVISPGSVITAIDKSSNGFKHLKGVYNEVTIETLQEDFTAIQFAAGIDGFLMANSLHYVKDQKEFVGNLKQQLKKEGSIIIVEYDTDRSNPWVPYPVNADKLRLLFEANGFSSINFLASQPSVYGTTMYSAIIRN
ncbi:class I SAM-dependent methyltransferase [Ferruginibacter sp.]